MRREVEKVKRSLPTAPQEVESRLKDVESRSRFEEEEFSETPTRAQFEKLNTDLFKETLKPGPKVREDDDLTKKEVDEIFPAGSPTAIPTVQSHVGGYPRGRNQEQKGEMGDNMYTTVTMPQSVHCGEQCRTTFRTVCRTW